ncbi:NAD(P)H-dependent oxidoreductase [Eubacteriales bacterium OttesenSCG-928-A19]|nr:NAD(P)H-dependent oxidoreductase [Eubacteriales bacterium OttesenSCG-928-A19]
MRILLVHGSPKRTASATGMLLDALSGRLGEGHTLTRCDARELEGTQTEDADAIVIGFPLYVDGLPSQLLRALQAAEGRMRPGAMVYAVVNNGFFEAEQNLPAFAMLRHWCARSGLVWGQGLGIGGGGMAQGLSLESGPLRPAGEALGALAESIIARRSGEDILVRPAFPRFLYIRFAHIGWRRDGRHNGVSRRALRARACAKDTGNQDPAR